MLTKTLKNYPLSLICTLAITILSLAPIGAPEVAQDVPFFDKWAHFVMYGGLSFLLFLESHKRPITLPLAISLLLYACLLGGLMEIGQATLTTYRSGEWLDFVADSIGVLLGCPIALLAKKYFPSH